MRTVLESQFTLKKVKRLKGGGLEINYEVVDTVGQETYYDEAQKKSSKEPHPDLVAILRSLGAEVGRILKLNTISLVVGEKDFNASAAQKDYAERAATNMFNTVRVNGISVTGTGENKGCKILAVYQPDSMQALAVNPQIRFNADMYGFEGDVEDKLEALEKECYAYLFEDKKAQLEIFDEDD